MRGSFLGSVACENFLGELKGSEEGVEYPSESFTVEEAELLSPYVTNLDRPVFALRNLPEVTKGALFARYSRSAKSLRRLLLDEFLGRGPDGPEPASWQAGENAGAKRAGALYTRVLSEFGDDSVAQLGFAHVACEQVSNVLTKIMERGRLASYLEQSTRYIAYDDKPGGRWRYALDPDLLASPLKDRCLSSLDALFSTYSDTLAVMTAFFAEQFPHSAEDSPIAWKRAIRARACDAVRGLLPAATVSNVGIAASGQAFESLLLRLQAHPLAEARYYGALLHEELAKVIPDFVQRVGRPDRGGVWKDYLSGTRAELGQLSVRLGLTQPTTLAAGVTNDLQAGVHPAGVSDGAYSGRRDMLDMRDTVSDAALVQARSDTDVTLTDWDWAGEIKVLAACLYPHSALSDTDLLRAVSRLQQEDRSAILRAAVGERSNRRHKPGRGFERTDYRFDILTDYGAFRDLQRHRMLHIEQQELGADLGYDVPEAVREAGCEEAFRSSVEQAADTWEAARTSGFARQAVYCLPLAFRIRFVMQMNAREAFHVIELRSSPQGHPAYRRVACAMHRLISGVHPAIGSAMSYVDHTGVGLGRLAAEQGVVERAQARAGEVESGGL